MHSYKDLPTRARPAVRHRRDTPREDAGDALVARDGLVLGELPAGSVIGTSARDGPRSLEHWVSVWKSAPYEATLIPG